MRKVIGIGETIFDIIFKGNQPTAANPGGSVFNGLVSLGRLGVPVLFVSELGNDQVAGMILAFMEENNISTEYIDRYDRKSPVSLAFLDADNNAHYTFYKDYPEHRLDVSLPPIEKDDIFVFGSYYSLDENLRPRIVEFVEYAKSKGAIIYYDPNFRKAHAHEAIKLRPTILENLEYADMVKGSTEDFNNLFHMTDPQKLYIDHIKFYCPNFICTRGAAGVELFCNQGNRHFATTPVTPVSTIGAGDSFNAGVLFGLLKHDITLDRLYTLTPDEWAPIIQYGMEFSAAVCLSMDNYIDPDFAARYRTED